MNHVTNRIQPNFSYWHKHCGPTVISLLIAGLLWLPAAYPDTRTDNGAAGATAPPSAGTLPDFSLTDQNNQPFNRQSLTGKWTFMFFGYTHCPDVCPSTLNVMTRLYHELQWQTVSQSEKVQLVFVSVDPMRDDQKTMKEFLNYFNNKLIGVTGPISEVNKITETLSISHRRMYAKHRLTGERHYLVEHAADIVLLAPDLKLQTRFSFPQDAVHISARFQDIRRKTISCYTGTSCLDNRDLATSGR